MNTLLSRVVAVLLCATTVGAQSKGLEVTNLNINKNALGKNGSATLRFQLPPSEEPLSWTMTCHNAEIAGWESPKPVDVEARTGDGAIQSVRGPIFPSETKVRVDIKRPKSAAKGEIGKCRIVVFPAGKSTIPNVDQGTDVVLSYK